MIRHLRPKHQAMIERLQPYKRGRLRRKSLLFLLKEINNTDKHQVIQVVGSTPASHTYQGDLGELTLFYPILQDGAKVLEAPVSYVYMQPTIRPSVAFWQGCEAAKGRLVCETIFNMAYQVSQVLERFAPEFPA
jgi:hypothetical protein